MSARARRTQRKQNIDYPLLVTVVVLTIFGLIAVWATSIPEALKSSDNASPLKYVLAQLQSVVVGVVAAAIAYKLGYRFLAKISLPLMLVVAVLLGYVAQFGKEINGSKRWIALGSLSFQPSEIAKLVIIIYLAFWLSSKDRRKLADRDTGLIPFMILVGLYVGLVLAQPDYSTAFLMVGVALVMFLMAGADIKQVGALLLTGAVAAVVFAFSSPYRRERLYQYFVNSESPAAGLAKSAGFLGRGFDQVQSQANRIPGAYNDYIFAFTTYGFGIAIALLLVAAFLFLGYRAVRIAQQAPPGPGMLISIGIASWLLLQALAHIAVSAGAIPITGLTLPFISYGGSSLLACLAGVGVLLSISEERTGETKTSAVYPYRGRNRRPRVSKSRRSTRSARKRTR